MKFVSGALVVLSCANGIQCNASERMPGLDMETCIYNGTQFVTSYCDKLRAMDARDEASRLRLQQQANDKQIADQKARDETEQQRLRALTPPAPVYRIERPKPRGQHHWAWHEGEQFGYRKALSESDRRLGIVTAPLLLVVYQGKQGTTHRFVALNPTVLMKCSDACENMSMTSEAGPQVVPVAPGSILWSIVQDARNGWFTFGPVFTNDPNYKPQD